jgi:hypothetical protein
MLVPLLLVLICTVVVKASHFNGGTIIWAALDPSNISSPVLITITQTYSWTYPKVNCTTDVPITTPAYASNNATLNCVANCSTDGNYQPVYVYTDCISASLSLGVMLSTRPVNITLPLDTYFWLSYSGGAWRTLQNIVGNKSDWNISALINLQVRPDGIINTPPVAQINSPQYVIVNRTSTIIIPVSDVNTNDDVRCRWSLLNRYCRRRRINKPHIFCHNQPLNFKYFQFDLEDNNFFDKIREKFEENSKDSTSRFDVCLNTILFFQ